MKWFATTYPVSRMILLESWKSVFYNTLRLAMVQSAAPPCPHPQLVACMPCIDMGPLLGPLLHSWYLQPSQEGRRQAAAQAFGFAITPTANAQPANDSLSLSNENTSSSHEWRKRKAVPTLLQGPWIPDPQSSSCLICFLFELINSKLMFHGSWNDSWLMTHVMIFSSATHDADPPPT